MAAGKRRRIDLDWLGVILAVILLGTLSLCSGCNTIEAIEKLPEDWWIGMETVLLGLWADVVSVLELLL